MPTPPPDVYTAPSPIAGTGVFAARPFAAGERIVAVDDTDVITADRPLRPELGEFEHHCDMIEDGKIILLKEPIRSINHCCDPNAFCRVLDGVRWVVARRSIAAGEEITTDYCVNSAIPDHEWPCSCGSARCRGVVRIDWFSLSPDFQAEYRPLLDEWFIREHLSGAGGKST
jgi:hypothetical protein